jgi:hypothetical protein
VSIGCISAKNDTFYAEFSDCATEFVSKNDEQFFKESLRPNLRFWGMPSNNRTARTICGIKGVEAYGDTQYIAETLNQWLLTTSRGGSVQMWSDCLAYDWVLFCNLWGHALNLPGHVYYIPMDLSTLLFINGVDPDINREVYAEYEVETMKHNALHDANIIKLCVEKAMNNVRNTK